MIYYNTIKKDKVITYVYSEEVAIMMMLLKVGRTKSRKAVKDHFVDMAGYAAIAGEIVLGGKDDK